MINRINDNDYHDYSKLKMPNAAEQTENGEKFSLNYQHAQKEKDDKDKEDQAGDGQEVKVSAGVRPQSVMQGGVKLELSGGGQLLSNPKREEGAPERQTGAGLIDTIRSWLTALVQTLKDILYKIWNDPAPQDDGAGSAEPVEAAGAGHEQTESSVAIETAGAAHGRMESAAGAGTAAGIGEPSRTDAPERLTEEYRILNNLESLRNPAETARQQVRRETARDREIQKYLRSGNLEQVINLVTDNGHKTMAKNSTLLTYYDRTGRITPLSASDQERILHGDRNVTKL